MMLLFIAKFDVLKKSIYFKYIRYELISSKNFVHDILYYCDFNTFQLRFSIVFSSHL